MSFVLKCKWYGNLNRVSLTNGMEFHYIILISQSTSLSWLKINLIAESIHRSLWTTKVWHQYCSRIMWPPRILTSPSLSWGWTPPTSSTMSTGPGCWPLESFPSCSWSPSTQPSTWSSRDTPPTHPSTHPWLCFTVARKVLYHCLRPGMQFNFLYILKNCWN